ncbi:MAG: Ldh family oxidoreductase [Sphaerochaetaceae bacterium]|nr:Ldh family oxidoreductase [Sphaerochaetaceae bacterium]
MEKIILAESLGPFVHEIFVKAGVPEERATVLANCLVEADLNGISSHGVIRVPVYVRRILQGLTETKAVITPIEDFPASALLDGKNVIGQVAGEEAMRIAIQKARTVGIACVGLRGTNHFGTCGHYSEMAAKSNMIGFSFVNTTPLVAVYGGTRKAVGNNPLSIAIPAKEHFPIILDMACSVAQGKIEILKKKGLDIPSGWAVDEEGNPTTDPDKALKGVLLPIAGPKGSGLAIAIDILCGILTGSGVGNEIRHLNDPEPQNLGAFFIAIDIAKFTNVDMFLGRVDHYVDCLKGSAREGEHILMPGEECFINHGERLITGIPFPSAVLDDLNEVAAQLGMTDRI